MNPRLDTTGAALSRWVGRIVVSAIVLYVLWRTREIIVITLLSAVLAAALGPLVDRLNRIRIPRATYATRRLIATTVVFTVFLALLVVSVSWLSSPFSKEFNRLAAYVRDISGNIDSISSSLTRTYSKLPVMVRQIIDQQDASAITERLAALTARFSAVATKWIANLWEILLIPVLAFYFVLDSGTLKKMVVSMFARRHRREVMSFLRDASLVFRSYIAGQLILCLIAGVFMGLLLSGLNVKYAVTLSVLAGVTRAVPIVGPIFSGVLIVIVIMATNFQLAMTVLAIFCVLHFVESKIITPVLIGDLMRLHPALLLLAILVGYEFFGVMGMFLAAPGAALARNLIVRYYIDRRDSGQTGSGGTGPEPRLIEAPATEGSGDAPSTAVA